jgi:hypothetical protein
LGDLEIVEKAMKRVCVGGREQLFAQLAGKRRQVSRVQHVLFGDALRHAHVAAKQRTAERFGGLLFSSPTQTSVIAFSTISRSPNNGTW